MTTPIGKGISVLFTRVCQECRREIDSHDRGNGPKLEKSSGESTGICRTCWIEMAALVKCWVLFHFESGEVLVVDDEQLANDLVNTGRWRGKVQTWVE